MVTEVITRELGWVLFPTVRGGDGYEFFVSRIVFPSCATIWEVRGADDNLLEKLPALQRARKATEKRQE